MFEYVQKDIIVILEAINTKVLEEEYDIYMLHIDLYADSDLHYEEDGQSASDKDLDNDH